MEIAKSRYVEHCSSVENLITLAERVHVFHKVTCEDLSHYLQCLDQDIAAQGIGVVVVDSIASLVRKEFDTRSGRGVAERIALLSKQAARLKLVHNVFIVCRLFVSY